MGGQLLVSRSSSLTTLGCDPPVILMDHAKIETAWSRSNRPRVSQRWAGSFKLNRFIMPGRWVWLLATLVSFEVSVPIYGPLNEGFFLFLLVNLQLFNPKSEVEVRFHYSMELLKINKLLEEKYCFNDTN